MHISNHTEYQSEVTILCRMPETQLTVQCIFNCSSSVTGHLTANVTISLCETSAKVKANLASPPHHVAFRVKSLLFLLDCN